MKEEEIIEGNKLIAEFMGYEYIGGDVMHYPYLRKGDETIAVHNDVCYHSSWDWLMPVVEKIEAMGYSVVIYNTCCDLEKADEGSDTYSSFITVSHPQAKSKIEAAWIAIIKFIKWYNSTK